MGAVLYGECVSARATAPVRISELAGLGCDLETDTQTPSAMDVDVALWIGAVGPFPGVVTHKAERHISVRFNEPIDGRILEHFGV